jgi:hypothetical protein
MSVTLTAAKYTHSLTATKGGAQRGIKRTVKIFSCDSGFLVQQVMHHGKAVSEQRPARWGRLRNLCSRRRPRHRLHGPNQVKRFFCRQIAAVNMIQTCGRGTALDGGRVGGGSATTEPGGGVAMGDSLSSFAFSAVSSDIRTSNNKVLCVHDKPVVAPRQPVRTDITREKSTDAYLIKLPCQDFVGKLRAERAWCSETSNVNEAPHTE